MSQIVIGWQDVEGLDDYRNVMRAIGSQQVFGDVARRALNHTGDKARTQVVRALTKQTGLKRKVIVKAVKTNRANYSNYTYRLRSRGGDISLKHFKPSETLKGVKASPFGKRQLFAGTFLKAGRFPNRVAVGAFNGNVFQRTRAKCMPIEIVKSGVIIPNEMVQGASAKAFEHAVKLHLPGRFKHELGRATGGVWT